MRYACSYCHHAFESAESPEHCPNCKVEAGLEKSYATPMPMKAFALCLTLALTGAVVGSILSLMSR